MFTRRSLSGLAVFAAGLATAPVAAAKLPGDPVLFSGQTLASGQVVTSPDGHYELVMGADGNLVESVTNPHGTPRSLFASGTGGHPGASATLETTGALVVNDATGVPLWSDNATASGCTNLDLQTDGNLVTYDGDDTAYWSAGTESHVMAPGDELLPGQILFGAGGDYRLAMSATGVLYLDDSAGRVWTAPKGGSLAEMNANGDFEVLNPTGSIAWDSGTDTAGASMYGTSTGALEVLDPSTGKALWSSGTSATRSGLGQLNGGRLFVDCPVATAPAPTPPAPPPAPTPTPIHPRQPVTGTTKVPESLTLPGIKVSIDFRWTYLHKASWISHAIVEHFPKDARLTVTCAGRHGCPRRTIRVHHHTVTRRAVFSAGSRHLHALFTHLVGLRFHAGDSVLFTVTEPHHRSAGQRAVIRNGRKPLNRPLPKAH